MTYPFKRANTIFAKDLTELVKSSTLHKYTYVGTEDEVNFLRSRALSFARCRDIIITTTKVRNTLIKDDLGNTINAIKLKYDGKLHPRKRLQYTR